jgi:uncharacterized protein
MPEQTESPSPRDAPGTSDYIEDPVMRVRYRLSRQGEVLRVELWAEPGSRATEHFHPRLEERFEVREGEFTFEVDGQKRRALPGDRLVVEAGVRHTFANTGPAVGHFVAEVEPALGMQEVFEESAALARAGMFLRPGIPKGLRGLLAGAEFMERHRETIVLTLPPPALQRILIPPLARFARRRRAKAHRQAARAGSGQPALPLPSRIMAQQYKLYDRMRHTRAFEVAREQGTARDMAAFQGARQALIVTFKRSGEPVPTPVNFGLSDEGKLYFRSEPHVAKVRRLRRDPHVRVCPCNSRGKPLGPLVEGQARVLPNSENERAYSVIASNWSPGTRLMERFFDRIDVPMAYVEVTPSLGGGAAREKGRTSALRG